MQMIGQDDDGIDGERMPRLDIPKGRSQVVNVLGQEPLPPVRKVDREEKLPPGTKLRR